MFLHIGDLIDVPVRDIIGIFNIPVSERSGQAKTKVVTSQGTYCSPIAALTLRQRIEKPWACRPFSSLQETNSCVKSSQDPSLS